MTTLDELDALAAAATPGPWEAWPRESTGDLLGDRQKSVIGVPEGADRHDALGFWAATGMNARDREDAAYIAAADPATVRALVAVVRAAQALEAAVTAAEEEAALEPLWIALQPFEVPQ